jgi:hypothetical protein
MLQSSCIALSVVHRSPRHPPPIARAPPVIPDLPDSKNLRTAQGPVGKVDYCAPITADLTEAQLSKAGGKINARPPAFSLNVR